jgi:plasmid stability protein
MLTIRNLDPEVDKALRAKAQREGKSMNTVVLEILRSGLISKRERRFHDLDALAGAWSPAEAKQFDAAIANFSSIDRELWK